VDLHETLEDDAAALQPELAELRHRLHRVPEVGLQLPRTQELVLEAIDGLGLEVTQGEALTSVTAVLRGGRPGPAVLLRGDMDGLPVQEETGLPWASELPGAMHACGHDLHTAMLAGAARLLAAHRDQLAGDVVFMFQPGEEGFDGAGRMLDEGVLDAAGHRVSSAYGMHVMSSNIRGEGGHGSTPHRGKDPVTVAAEMVTALQTMVTRRFDIFDPVVVTVGSFHAGTKRNIIPDTAHFEATVRTFSVAARDRIRAESVRLCRDLAAAHGLEVDAEYLDEYPPTVNDAEHTRFASGVAAEVFGGERVTAMANPDPGAEDFSRVLAEVPGCYLFLGAVTGGDPASAPSNHSPRATFDDAVLSDGVLLHAQLAVRALERDAAGAGVAAG
jgi:hippurate hydrolase